MSDQPKKRNSVSTSQEKAEALLANDAWKLAAMGILPGIVIGKSAATIADETVDFVAS